MAGGDLQIGPYVLSIARRTLTLDEQPVHIGDRAFDLLCVLAERPGEVISKRELFERVWSGLIVEESSLRFHVATLRKALDPASQVQILNVAGRGYTLSVVGAPPIPEVHLPRRVHNLPAPRTRLIGRDEIVADLVSELGASRLVTLVGPGGVGKTSVALAVAEDLLEQFDRVCLVDFGAIDQPESVPLSVVVALQIPAAIDDVLPAIVADLNYGSTLLLLDNCEHVIGEVARLADVLLNTVARISILATSREPLNVASEKVRRIDPLRTPPVRRPSTAAEALLSPAVQLFAERASYASAFVLVDEDAATVADTCSRLDGLPLAIEMAAGWLRFLPPKTLAEQLGRRPFLDLPGKRTAQSRHRTLHAVLDWSYDSLDARQRLLFACLSVFRSAFSMEEAQGVALSSPGETLLDLVDLVEKSLVEARSESGQGRYRMLLVPRAYAEAKLRETDHEEEVKQRHSRVVLETLQTSSDEWWTAPRAEWAERTALHIDDLKVALDWALGEPGNAVLACDLAHEAASIWFRLAIPLDGATYLEAALDKLARTPDAPPVLALRLKIEQTALEFYTRGPPKTALQELAGLQQAVDATGDRDLRRLHAWTCWLVSTQFDEFAVGLRSTDTFEQLATEEGDDVTALFMRSCSYFGLGDLRRAQKGYEQVVQNLRGVDRNFRGTPFHLDQLASAYRNLSRVRLVRGNGEGALDAAKKAVEVAETTQHSATMQAALLDSLVMVALFVGDYDLAEAAIDRYRMLPVAVELRREVVEGLWGVLIGQIDAVAAVSHIRNCLNGQALRYVIQLGPALGEMCERLGQAGDPESGLSYVEQIFARLRGTTDVNLPEFGRAKAALLKMQGHPGWREEADTLLDEALAQAVAQGSLAWELRIRTDQARLWAANGRRDEAIANLRDVLSRYPVTDTRDRVEAERVLLEIAEAGTPDASGQADIV